MDDDEIAVPAEFWQSIGTEQAIEIIGRGGRLNAAESKLLWRLLKRRDKPPKGFQLTTMHPRTH